MTMIHNSPHFKLNIKKKQTDIFHIKSSLYRILTTFFDHKQDERVHHYKQDQQAQTDGKTG